jgi:hypothetical protein
VEVLASVPSVDALFPMPFPPSMPKAIALGVSFLPFPKLSLWESLSFHATCFAGGAAFRNDDSTDDSQLSLEIIAHRSRFIEVDALMGGNEKWIMWYAYAVLLP